MTVHQREIRAGGAMPPATITVWDPFIRLFHWSLVSLFVVAFATSEDGEWLHLMAGYAIAALAVMRILWGFVGPRHARFSDFVKSPRAVLAYLRDAVFLRAPRYLGHNPAGGAMILAILLMLVGTCTTGIAMTADAFRDAKWLEELHEALANSMIALVVLHVFGVIVASIKNRENLVQAMFSGRKRPR